jgi:hypothetical protein
LVYIYDDVITITVNITKIRECVASFTICQLQYGSVWLLSHLFLRLAVDSVYLFVVLSGLVVAPEVV